MLAAVLWLGNISFTVIDNENHVQAVEDEGKNFPEPLLMDSTAYIFWLHDRLQITKGLPVCRSLETWIFVAMQYNVITCTNRLKEYINYRQ